MEWTQYGFDYDWMRRQNAEYATDEYFPSSVHFREPSEPVDYKDDILDIYPETREQATMRAATLYQLMNRRVEAESEKGKKRICYLIITHGLWVDSVAHILTYM